MCIISKRLRCQTLKESLHKEEKEQQIQDNHKIQLAKPTYVKTDSPRKMKKEEIELIQEKDKKGKGSGTKDACYQKVKSRYSVWISAYASGALVKCRKVGAATGVTSLKDFPGIN